MGEKRVLFAFALFALVSLFLSGCLEQLNSFNFQANSSVSVSNGSLEVSVNATGVPRAPSQIELFPRNASVCTYGEPDERFSYNYFGNLSLPEGSSIALYTRWYDANSTARNASFSDCAVIVLLDDSEGQFVERNVREKIVAQLRRGAGLIVSGEGGVYSSQDSSVYGWKLAQMQEFVPVSIESPGSDAKPLGRTTFSGKLSPVRADPSMHAVQEFLFDSWSVVHSLPIGEVVAYARQGGETSPTQPVYPAVVRTPENASHNAGYFFSFNAPNSPPIFANTVRFLSSEYFKYFFLRVA